MFTHNNDDDDDIKKEESTQRLDELIWETEHK